MLAHKTGLFLDPVLFFKASYIYLNKHQTTWGIEQRIQIYSKD